MKIKIHKQALDRMIDPAQYGFTIVAANGETVATSEMYTRKQAAFGGAHVVVTGVLDALQSTMQSRIDPDYHTRVREHLIVDETGEG